MGAINRSFYHMLFSHTHKIYINRDLIHIPRIIWNLQRCRVTQLKWSKRRIARDIWSPVKNERDLGRRQWKRDKQKLSQQTRMRQRLQNKNWRATTFVPNETLRNETKTKIYTTCIWYIHIYISILQSFIGLLLFYLFSKLVLGWDGMALMMAGLEIHFTNAYNMRTSIKLVP